MIFIAVILASKSPRRAALLRMIGLEDFCVVPADTEEIAPPGASPAATVCQIAGGKCRAVASRSAPGDLIIAADTLVYLDGAGMGKPQTPAHALHMLLALSDRRHAVYTGVALQKDGDLLCQYEKTDVFFRKIGREEARAYVDTGEPMDKAGGYGIQGRGAVFVRRIEGDYFNVVGLPLCRLTMMLSEMGVGIL